MSIIRMQNLQPQKINVPWYRINPFLLQSNLLYLGLRSRLTTPVQNSCKARNMQKVNEKSRVSPKHRQTITIHSPKEVSLLRKTTTSKPSLIKSASYCTSWRSPTEQDRDISFVYSKDTDKQWNLRKFNNQLWYYIIIWLDWSGQEKN